MVARDKNHCSNFLHADEALCAAFASCSDRGIFVLLWVLVVLQDRSVPLFVQVFDPVNEHRERKEAQGTHDAKTDVRLVDAEALL